MPGARVAMYLCICIKVEKVSHDGFAHVNFHFSILKYLQIIAKYQYLDVLGTPKVEK